MLRKIPLIFLLSLALSISLAALIISLNNSLKNRNVWIFPKTDRVQGSTATFNSYRFSIDKISLSKGVANLGTWHGHQQIETSGEYSVSKFSFSARLDEDAVLYVFVSDKKGKKAGLRLSNTSLFPPMKFTIDSDFKFDNVVSIKDLTNTKWNDYEISLLDLNTTDLDLSSLRVGFRNEYKPVYIDNIRVYDQTNRLVFVENFFWTKKSFFFVIMVSLLFTIIFSFLSKLLDKKIFMYVLTASLTCTVILAFASFAFCFFFFSKYPAQFKSVEPPTIERFHQWNKKRPESDDYYFKLGKPFQIKNIRSVIVLGSSQAAGEGASSAELTWPEVLKKNLNTKFDKKINLKNHARPGDVARNQVEIFKENLPPANSIVIFSMGNNDTYIPNFSDAVKELVNISKKSNYNLILNFEPNDPQVNSTTLISNHGALREICKNEPEVTCLDMHSYLLQDSFFDSGWMWNDHVHGSNYTYQLMADKITSILLSN
jgi:lysophospholipase L1-like esterase